MDLVIWNEDQSGYRQLLHDEVTNLIGNSTEVHLIDRPGGIFVCRPEQMSEEDRILLQMQLASFCPIALAHLQIRSTDVECAIR